MGKTVLDAEFSIFRYRIFAGQGGQPRLARAKDSSGWSYAFMLYPEDFQGIVNAPEANRGHACHIAYRKSLILLILKRKAMKVEHETKGVNPIENVATVGIGTERHVQERPAKTRTSGYREIAAAQEQQPAPAPGA